MGGRGASGNGHISVTGKTNYGVAMKRQNANPYMQLSKDALNRELSRQKAIVAQNQITARLNGNTPAIKRKAKAAQKAIDKADAKIALIEKALKKAKDNIPF